MILTHLSLTNFRNFTRLDTDVPLGTTLLVGSNAQGKTSLLEAVYMLATLTSFHAESDRQLINFLQTREPLAVARIVADFQKKGDSQHLEVRIIQEQNNMNARPRVRKQVLLNGLNKKVSEAVGAFNAVLFLPQMLQIVAGSPNARRRYLDMALAQVMPGYTRALSQYGRVLSQRNALLKQLLENGGDPNQLTYWDEQTAALGAQVIYGRIQAVQEMEIIAARLHYELTRGKEVLRLVYQPAFDPLPSSDEQYEMSFNDRRDRSSLSLQEIQNGFCKALGERRRQEIARGVTTIGPHRDEIRFLSNGIDLGTYGSRGQLRTTLLSLKLAELDWIREKSGHDPVLLLDEVLAELDHHRRQDLLARVSESAQVLLTTTDLNLFSKQFVGESTLWKISRGRLES